MSRIRLGVLGVLSVLAVLAVGAIGASSASASFTLTTEKCDAGTTAINLCYTEKEGGELLELKGEEVFKVEKDEGETLLEENFGAEVVHIVCTEAKGEGTAVQNEPLKVDYSIVKLILHFNGCALLPPLSEKCKVPVLLETLAILGHPETDEEVRKLTDEEVRYTPEAGESTNFIVLPIEEKAGCPLTILGKQVIKGSQNCKWLEPLVDLLVHLIDCEAAGSLLKLGAGQVTFELLKEVKMTNLGPDKWDITEVL